MQSIFCRGVYLAKNTSQSASVEFVCCRQTNYARGRLQAFCSKRAPPFLDSLKKRPAQPDVFFSEVHGALQHPQVIGLKGDAAVFLHVYLHAGPVGVDLAVLLDENVVQNVIGHAVVPGFLNGGIGQGLVIGHVQALILEVEAVAHAAAVQPPIGEQPLQVLQNGVMVLVIQVLRRGLGIVVPELDGDAVGQEPLHILGELLRRVLLIQHAVDAGGTGDLPQHLVGTLLHIFHQVAGDVHAGDLVPVAAGKVQHLLRRVEAGLHREGGVDIHLVGGGDGVQHFLQGLQIGQRLAAGEHKVAPGGDGVHGADAVQNGVQAEAGAVGVFLFVDAEGAVVVAVVGHEHRDGGPALAGLIGVAHILIQSSQKIFPNILYLFHQKSKEFLTKFT